MDLVVAGHAQPLRVEHQRAVEHTQRVGAGQRDGAPGNPQPVTGGLLSHKVLNGAAAGGLGNGQLVAIAVSEQAKILWQDGQFGPLLRCLRQAKAGRVQVGADFGARHHLDGCHFHG